ncbi:MAG: fluoride efflux transporter CrcB [Sphingobacteriaceae bacterium]|nr:fluoride efflux transporter CrcB [Cytophagaceae bacterium]
MNQLFLIFLGGGLGSLSRFFLGKAIQERAGADFPLGTLGVNLVASLVLGFFIGLAEAKNLSNPNFRALVAIGFCGGFSTFSTFANDNLLLFLDQRPLAALLNILLNVTGCIVVTFGGLWLGKSV